MDVPTGQAGITPVPPRVAPGGLSQANPECAFGVSSGCPSVGDFSWGQEGWRPQGGARDSKGMCQPKATPVPQWQSWQRCPPTQHNLWDSQISQS